MGTQRPVLVILFSSRNIADFENGQWNEQRFGQILAVRSNFSLLCFDDVRQMWQLGTGE